MARRTERGRDRPDSARMDENTRAGKELGVPHVPGKMEIAVGCSAVFLRPGKHRAEPQPARDVHAFLKESAGAEIRGHAQRKHGRRISALQEALQCLGIPSATGPSYTGNPVTSVRRGQSGRDVPNTRENQPRFPNGE